MNAKPRPPSSESERRSFFWSWYSRVMNTEKIKELGQEWKALDEKYDNAFAELIDAGQSTISLEKLEEMKKMQNKLFDLETELYKLLQI